MAVVGGERMNREGRQRGDEEAVVAWKKGAEGVRATEIKLG